MRIEKSKIEKVSAMNTVSSVYFSFLRKMNFQVNLAVDHLFVMIIPSNHADFRLYRV